MKKITVIIAGIFLALSATQVKSQSNADYFTGSWNILLKGTPNGDVKMIFKLDKVNDSLTGIVQDSTGAQISDMSKIEKDENGITVYFTAQGYDVNVMLAKKDDDHVTGSLMNMFDVEGERVKK
ncbi:MAG TPA: hypothetical protein VHB48_17595 [Chitinophagaceae bacterium]|nr:hypothetical protein [Chitinophagaceae bacterium]